MPASLLDPDYQFGTSPLPGGAPTDLLGQPLQATPPQDTSTDLGAGLAQTYQDVSDYISRQREQSRQMGLLGDNGLPTGAGVVDAARQYAQGVMMGTTAPGDVPPPGIVAYHGSPADFNRFSDDFIGTGEGNQAYGRGHYFGEAEQTAINYRDQLSSPTTPDQLAAHYLTAMGGNRGQAMAQLQHNATFDQPPEDAAALLQAHELLKSGATPNPTPAGHMYEVNIGADPEHFLDWDKPLSEQHPAVQQALQDIHSDKVFTAPDAVTQLDNGRFALTQDGNVVGRADGWPDRSTAEYVQKMLQDEAKNNATLTGGDLLSSRTSSLTPEGHAQALRDAGIPGIRYLDQGSRAQGQGTHNYVVFDPATIDILRKYGIAGLMLGGGAVATQRQGNQ